MKEYAKKLKRLLSAHKKVYVLAFIGIILIPSSFVIAEIKNDSTPYPPNLYSQCFDGKDNDNDGTIDLKDIDCPKCFDGIDNDLDGLIDIEDPDCPKAEQANKGVFKAAAAALLFGDASKTERLDNVIDLNSIQVINPVRLSPAERTAVEGTGCLQIIVYRKTIRTQSGGKHEYVFKCDNRLPRGEKLDDIKELGVKDLPGPRHTTPKDTPDTVDLPPPVTTNTEKVKSEKLPPPILLPKPEKV